MFGLLDEARRHHKSLPNEQLIEEGNRILTVTRRNKENHQQSKDFEEIDQFLFGLGLKSVGRRHFCFDVRKSKLIQQISLSKRRQGEESENIEKIIK